MEKIFVKPAPGLRVRRDDDPRTCLPETGAEVPRNAYWLRRLGEGDVMMAEAAPSIPAEPAPESRERARKSFKTE